MIKCWDQKILDDRLRLQGSNFTDVQTLERLKKLSSVASRDEHLEGESQKEDTQANPNTQQELAALYEKFYQLIITMSKTVLDIREKEMELKVEPDEQAKQTIKILTDAMVSMSRKMPPSPGTTQHQQAQQQDQQDLQDAQICELCKMAWKAAESRFATIIEQLERQVTDQQQQKHQQTCDNTVQAPINPTNFQDIKIDKAQGLEQLSQTNDEDSLLVGKSVPTSKEVVVDEQQTQPQAHGIEYLHNRKEEIPSKSHRPGFSQEDSYETTQEKNTEEDITGSVDLDKDVNETIEAEEYPVPSALDETKNPTPPSMKS
ncbi:OLC1v1009250C1 [Oldenlandia corymbosa var. corymbosa]|uniref:OLC1v1009250C1 n=1 Tax=Oldenlandia corymbosa var. corymbosa TaxID=529605 RepID=A0AAV1DP20_OLDCO|nr:OLC1v1009250C1 [Oldenlandia corymbosa var. corymbosa]